MKTQRLNFNGGCPHAVERGEGYCVGDEGYVGYEDR